MCPYNFTARCNKNKENKELHYCQKKASKYFSNNESNLFKAKFLHQALSCCALEDVFTDSRPLSCRVAAKVSWGHQAQLLGWGGGGVREIMEELVKPTAHSTLRAHT